MSLFYTQNISPVISIDERSFNIELKTPLYDVHVAEGGKIISFAGYLLPPITGFDFLFFKIFIRLNSIFLLIFRFNQSIILFESNNEPYRSHIQISERRFLYDAWQSQVVQPGKRLWLYCHF